MDKKLLKEVIDRFEKPNEFLIRVYHGNPEDCTDDIEEETPISLQRGSLKSIV